MDVVVAVLLLAVAVSLAVVIFDRGDDDPWDDWPDD